MRTIAFVFFTFCIVTSAQAQPQDIITVGVGRIFVIEAPDTVSAVLVGNPDIADIAVEGKTSVAIFGKSMGATDLVLMDLDHLEMMAVLIEVEPVAIPSDTLVVRRPRIGGIEEEIFICSPTCIRVGN